MTILLPQQILGSTSSVTTCCSPLLSTSSLMTPLSIFSGFGTSSCSSSGLFSQCGCNENQNFMQMMMGMFTMMLGFMQGMMGSMFNRGDCVYQEPQQPIIINNNYYDCSDKSVHNTTNNYITNKYTTNNEYNQYNQYNNYTTNNEFNTTNIQNNTKINNTKVNNTLNQQNISNIYDTKIFDTKINNTNINNTKITDIDNIIKNEIFA